MRFNATFNNISVISWQSVLCWCQWEESCLSNSLVLWFHFLWCLIIKHWI